MNHFKTIFFLYLSYFCILVLFFFNVNNSFFGDTVQLGSKHANYFLSINFKSILLPNIIDSGHIPAFGFYIGLIWKFFGRSLISSHLAMLPFVLGIIFQLHQLALYYFKKEHAAFVVFLVLLDPSLLAQTTLVSPDVPLIFLFFLSWNSILKNRKYLLSIAIFFLFLTSMRGMMISFCFLIIDLVYNYNFKDSLNNRFNALLTRSLIYIPACILFIIFSIHHFQEKGWVFMHADSPWAESFEKVDFQGVIYNIGLLGWRILDFGKVGIWLIFIILFFNHRKEILKDKTIKTLAFIFILIAILLPSNMVLAKSLTAHRYFIPIYLVFSIFVAKILFTLKNVKYRNYYFLFWIISIVGGNFWIYPDKIAQGWDSTLAYLPYNDLRKDALKYLDSENINFDNVQSYFPNTTTIDDIDLNGDERNLQIERREYAFYSNINNIDDETYHILHTEYQLIKEFKKCNIFIKIFKEKSKN